MTTPSLPTPRHSAEPQVWLVGAGPGDPELLTLKAVRVLNHAEIVLVDDLVNPQILQHCPQARIVAVGKRGGCRSTPQDFIQRLMLRYARQGYRLVRLKGATRASSAVPARKSPGWPATACAVKSSTASPPGWPPPPAAAFP